MSRCQFGTVVRLLLTLTSCWINSATAETVQGQSTPYATMPLTLTPEVLSSTTMLRTDFTTMNVPLAPVTKADSKRGGMYLYLEIDTLGHPIGTNFSETRATMFPARRVMNGATVNDMPISEALLENVKAVILFGGSGDDGLFIMPSPNTIAFFHARGIKVYGNYMNGPGWGSETICRADAALKRGNVATGDPNFPHTYPAAKRLANLIQAYNLDGWHFNLETSCMDSNWLDWAEFIDNLHFYRGTQQKEYLVYVGNGFSSASRAPSTYNGITIPSKRYRLMGDEPTAADISTFKARGLATEQMFAAQHQASGTLASLPVDYMAFRRDPATVNGVKALTSRHYVDRSNSTTTIYRTYFNAGGGDRWYIGGVVATDNSDKNAYEDILTFDMPKVTAGANVSNSVYTTYGPAYYGGTSAGMLPRSTGVPTSIIVSMPPVRILSGARYMLDVGSTWPIKRIIARGNGTSGTVYDNKLITKLPPGLPVNSWRLTQAMPLDFGRVPAITQASELEIEFDPAIINIKIGFMRLYKGTSSTPSIVAGSALDIDTLHGSGVNELNYRVDYTATQCDDNGYLSFAIRPKQGTSYTDVNSRVHQLYRTDLFAKEWDGTWEYLGSTAGANQSISTPRPVWLSQDTSGAVEPHVRQFWDSGDVHSRKAAPPYPPILRDAGHYSVETWADASNLNLAIPGSYTHADATWFVGIEGDDQYSVGDEVNVSLPIRGARDHHVPTTTRATTHHLAPCYFNRFLTISQD